MDSVQLAKARKSGASGGKTGEKAPPVKDRSHLPPSGAKSRLADSSDKQSSGEQPVCQQRTQLSRVHSKCLHRRLLSGQPACRQLMNAELLGCQCQTRACGGAFPNSLVQLLVRHMFGWGQCTEFCLKAWSSFWSDTCWAGDSALSSA